MEVSKKPMLLEVIRQYIRRKHYSVRTEKSYIHWIRRFVHFHGRRHPRDLRKVHIEASLTYLAVDRKVSASTPSGEIVYRPSRRPREGHRRSIAAAGE